MKLIIGSRGSALALAQTKIVKEKIESFFPDINIDTHVIKTTGDKILDTSLATIGGKGLFVKEIEEALLEKRIDIAVHSMKDMPAIIPDELCIGAILPRERYEDVLITKNKILFSELPKHSALGTSSLRRKAQLLSRRPDLIIKDLRGNVDTRLRKLARGDYDGIVIAYAGLSRLNFLSEITEILEFMLPAPCQGAIGIECRVDDMPILSVIEKLNDRTSQITIEAERSFLLRIGAGCLIPVAAIAMIGNGNMIQMKGLISNLKGSAIITEEIRGTIEENRKLGWTLADSILKHGGQKILDRIMMV